MELHTVGMVTKSANNPKVRSSKYPEGKEEFFGVPEAELKNFRPLRIPFRKSLRPAEENIAIIYEGGHQRKSVFKLQFVLYFD